jgi:hypothetical protein
MDSCVSWRGPVVGSCERGTEHSGCIKCGNFIHYLSNRHILKRESSPPSQTVSFFQRPVFLSFVYGVVARFRNLASPISAFETVDFLRGEEDVSPTFNPQPGRQVYFSISGTSASRSKPVQHGWPYHQLDCASTAFRVH